VNKPTLVLGFGLIFLVVLALWLFRIPDESLHPESDVTGSGKTPASTSDRHPESSGENDMTEEVAPILAPDPSLRAEIKILRDRLAQKPDRETTLRLLQEFSARWLQTDPDRAAATLLEFLRSGEDLGTGLDFVVGEAGLEEWPSLRAFLLDLLGKIDLGMASQYALTTVIPAKNSTLEYAVSLRILWNSGGAEEAKPELVQAWLGLLQKTDWSNRPDVAWMESMDFAGRIPTALPSFVALATGWLADPKNVAGKAEAAQLALERSTRNHPVETLRTLLANPGWLAQGRGPVLRATLFARADLSDPQQAEIFGRYLSTLDPESREATAFAKAFPYRKFSVSAGLSGLPDLQTPEQIRASNLAAEEFFRQVQTQGRYPVLKDKIAQIQNRLSELNITK
jgi:hypothetical protein